MKYAISLVVAVMASTVCAEVKKPGEFIASKCSPSSSAPGAQSSYGVQEVCYGKLYKLNKEAIEVRYLVGGDSQKVSILVVVGSIPSKKQKNVTKLIVKDATGKQSEAIVTRSLANGDVIGLSGRTPSNIYFVGNDFRPVVHTQ